jgi:DNA-binding GntR family transcriptional regulator
MDQLSKNNLSDQIFHLIGKKIVHNELTPGETIYETQISKELGVSRSPVRDALRMLEQIWLVERTPKGSYQVTELSIEKIQHLYETANVIYQFVFSKAAENVTGDDIAELEKFMAKVEASIVGNDFELYITNVTIMAHKILKIAGNPMIERIATELMPTAERVQWASITSMPDQLKTVVTHLRRGYDCIIERKPEAAAAAFKDFCTAHVQVVMDGLKPEPGEKAAI